MIDNIAYYYIKEDIVIEGVISDDNISIIDSYKVTSDSDKEKIIENLLESFPWFKETRTCRDMLDEWRVHNYCYSINYQRNRTRNTDFELKQNIILKFMYWLISKFIKKNI